MERLSASLLKRCWASLASLITYIPSWPTYVHSSRPPLLLSQGRRVVFSQLGFGLPARAGPSAALSPAPIAHPTLRHPVALVFPRRPRRATIYPILDGMPQTPRCVDRMDICLIKVQRTGAYTPRGWRRFLLWRQASASVWTASNQAPLGPQHRSWHCDAEVI